MSNQLVQQKFKNINLTDSFFDSLKVDYAEFESWFIKKHENEAYLFYDEVGNIQGFLYLKVEDEEVADVSPPLSEMKRMKIGTFKINAHGTRLGERFLKKVFDICVAERIPEMYVTVFPKHTGLIHLLKKFGFNKCGTKTTGNGTEDVLLKNLTDISNNVVFDYPRINRNGVKKHLLSIYPKFHTRLFADSKLNNEDYDILKDVSHTNSICKVYIGWMGDMAKIKKNDLIVIYRTKSEDAPAWYTSVATSICTVEEIKNKRDFEDKAEFINYCLDYAIFSEQELNAIYPRDNFFVLKLLYNVAFKKRLTRQSLIESAKLDATSYFGVLELSDPQFEQIVKDSAITKRYLI